MKSRRISTGPDAVELIEEAIHLLRRTPAAGWAVYVAGTVPFIIALLFFWAYTTWFRPAGEAVAWGALALTVLFVAMKTAQAEFCGHLMALRLDAAPPSWSWRRLGRIAFAQLSLQPWAFVGTVLASIAAFPFAWVFAYGQIVTVIGDGEQLHAAAVREAKRWPGQNHIALVLISGVALCVWLNLGTAFFVVPWMAERLFGIENLFGMSGWALLNTTTLAGVTALSWLAVDPLIKAFYTLWVFHARARRTGDDIRSEFSRLGLTAAASLRVAAVAAVLLLLIPAVPAAETPAPRPTAVQPAALDHAIDHVLAGSDFAWRLRPLPKPPGQENDGPLTRFARQGMEIMRSTLRTLGHWIQAVVDWFERTFSSSHRSRPVSRSGGVGVDLLRVLLYGFIGVAVVLLLWLVWLIVRQRSWSSTAVVAAQPVAAGAPDLRDENVQAAQLPADGWLALAQAEMARGEWRLALRALYLATLARLAADGLIRLATFKTNLDYERELRRRALSRTEITGSFSQRRRAFEEAWYGRARPSEADVRRWLAEMERPAAS